MTSESARSEFEAWLNTVTEQLAAHQGTAMLPEFNAWAAMYRTRNPTQNATAETDAYRVHVREFLKEVDTLACPITVQPGSLANLRLDEVPTDRLLAKVRIDHSPMERANGLRIAELRLYNCHVELTDCRISVLSIEKELSELVLKNCWIGHLEIKDGAVLGDCAIAGGGFLSIATPQPGAKLFKGYLEIDRRTYVPTQATDRMRTPNAYLYLRHQLTEVGNAEAAGFFARAEHYFNFRREPGAAKLVSFLYWLTSDYGTSITRPLVWSLGLVSVGTAFAYAVGPVLDPGFLTSSGGERMQTLLSSTWYSAFFGNDWKPQFARAMAAAWGAALNPFSIFGDRSVVQMPTLWSNLVLKFIGALATLSIAMLFLAIRRRFRLS